MLGFEALGAHRQHLQTQDNETDGPERDFGWNSSVTDIVRRTTTGAAEPPEKRNLEALITKRPCRRDTVEGTKQLSSKLRLGNAA